MARKGAMTQSPPLRGQARKDFRAARDAAVAAGEAVPSQDKFQPREPVRTAPQAAPQQSYNDYANMIAQIPQGQTSADVVGAVSGQRPTGGWWQGQQPPTGRPQWAPPMTKPGQGLVESMPMPDMPQPSANMGGQYRLSPGVYGTREQAMNQYNQQMQQMYQPAVSGAVNAPFQMPDFSRFGPVIQYNKR